MKKQLYRAAAATVLGLSLATGGVAAASPQYNNHHHHNNGGNKSLTANLSANVSNVGVNNVTDQNAYSGNANVSGASNDHHGDRHHHDSSSSSSDNKAMTGDTENNYDTEGSVTVHQSSAPAASPMSDSSNDNHHNGGNTSVDVSASLNVSNVEVNNQTDQNAYSGNATVTGNNKGGSATTGAATNNYTTGFDVTVTQ